ncbi:methylmalonyl-CoA epimerase [Geoalkalibacter ferrihydriticus]|uniref:Methylmalonyl-CoA epimerase n=2 Tax=Geoalkalibacter ferrihydriticus TaxID=392333 RepID=A0A0C2HL26_9BACT|nr:methylmalonyl-CoA epimerase [Geoalkalibacter ferrihydriticus]KIH77771.1 methylmalonyl-CoA epimerase [Geoalkalibacter ferrihydriticus DSM 17813]SDL78077.1 methylmalonyl-CoA epimerase [Geoalkalibacter ferrihydriticus]
MTTKKISHVGIAVKSLDAAVPLYRDVLGMEFEGTEVVAEQKVKVAFFVSGESRIELLEATSPDSPVAKFIEKNGEGVHHLAYEVDDLKATLARLQTQGVRLIDSEPRRGAHGTAIAFLHPKATGGVLTELCQPAQG